MCSTSTFVRLHLLKRSTEYHKHQTYHDMQENFTKSYQIQGAARDGLDNGWALLLLLPGEKLRLDQQWYTSTMWERGISEYLLKKKVKLRKQVWFWSNLFHFFPYLPYLSADSYAKTSKPLHFWDNPIACTASGGWHFSRASGPTILATLCSGQEPSKSGHFAPWKYIKYVIKNTGLTFRVGKKMKKAHHMEKREQTKDALLNGKQNSHPFHNTFTWSQYFPCCTISSWRVVNCHRYAATPFKSNRIGHAPAESQRSCPMLVLAAWACVGPVTSVNLRLQQTSF